MSELRILADVLRRTMPKDNLIQVSDMERIVNEAIGEREARSKCQSKKCPTCRGGKP